MKLVNFESRDFKKWMEPLRKFCDFHKLYPTPDRFYEPDTINKLYSCYIKRMTDSEAYDYLNGWRDPIKTRRQKPRLSYQAWLKEIDRFIHDHWFMGTKDLDQAMDLAYLQDAYEQEYSTLEGVDVVLGWIKVIPLAIEE